MFQKALVPSLLVAVATLACARPLSREQVVSLTAPLDATLRVQGEPGSKGFGDRDGWFWNPCLGDSVDTWGWTRYDLRGVRLRLPPDVRQQKVPSMDELHFRVGQATMSLRLHNDASQVFARVNMPDKRFKQCWGEFAGQLAEAITFKPGATSYGFAVLWPDADHGEWLAAVIQGTTFEDANKLRRALFAIDFPGRRR